MPVCDRIINVDIYSAHTYKTHSTHLWFMNVLYLLYSFFCFAVWYWYSWLHYHRRKILGKNKQTNILSTIRNISRSCFVLELCWCLASWGQSPSDGRKTGSIVRKLPVNLSLWNCLLFNAESILVVWQGSLFLYLFCNILLRSGRLVTKQPSHGPRRQHDMHYSFPAKTNSFEITR